MKELLWFLSFKTETFILTSKKFGNNFDGKALFVAFLDLESRFLLLYWSDCSLHSVLFAASYRELQASHDGAQGAESRRMALSTRVSFST